MERKSNNNSSRRRRQRESSNTRTRRTSKNRRRKVNYFRLVLVVCIFILFLLSIVWGIRKLFSKKSDTKSAQVTETVFETQKELTTEEKLKLIYDKLEASEKELVDRINTYIESNGLDKSKIGYAFKSLQNESTIVNSIVDKVPMKNYNTYILAMLAEDLNKEGKLNYNEIIDVKEYNEEVSESIFTSLGDLIEDMLVRGNVWMITAVREKVEQASRTEWKTLANQRYSLQISTNNDMSFENNLSVLSKLASKSNGHYDYNRTIQAMMKNAEQSSNVYYLAINNFIGYQGATEYEYNIESSIIIGNKPYIYSIYTTYSDESISAEIRKIINQWVNDFY